MQLVLDSRFLLVGVSQSCLNYFRVGRAFLRGRKKWFIQPLFSLFALENVNCLVLDTSNSLSTEER